MSVGDGNSDFTCRLEIAQKQLKLIEREKELLDKDQTVSTLREEVTLHSIPFHLPFTRHVDSC